MNTRSYSLPTKINSLLKRLDLEYTRDGNVVKRELVRCARVLIIEHTEYDNWNGGTTGHDVVFFLPEQAFSNIVLSGQRVLEEELRGDLNTCSTGIENEYFRVVRLELNDESDPEYQRARPYSPRPLVNPDMLPFWKQGQIRLFISHRDCHKRAATELASALENYGVSSFVAHETIRPTKEWRREIMNGLETMEVMLVFLTNDFSESTWTNQEVGFALGRGIPIVSLKLETHDPPGFISHEQALKGRLSHPASSAKAIQEVIADKMNRKERIQSALVEAFVTSSSWQEARDRFDLMYTEVAKLRESDLDRIVDAFARNNQLHDCLYLTNHYTRLLNFLERTTGRKFKIVKDTIRDAAPTPIMEDAVPF